MPADRPETDGRRSLVPVTAARSLWLSAAWTGLGAALFSIVVSIVAVAVCWLPAAGAAGNAGSSLRAGVLAFLTALHGGITVDGLDTDFVPLLLTVLAGLVAWRAGSGLADAAAELDEDDPARLARAGGLQALTFAVAATVAAALSRLGTSAVSPASAAFAGFVLFLVSGGVAFVRSTPLRDDITARLPPWPAPAIRAGAAAGAVYLGIGAVLVAVSVIVHHGSVEALSAEVGGGWAGVPVLLLGVLAVPNAAIAGAGYLAGPGFAVGSGNLVALHSTPHGTVPAFPVLAALPHGPASPLVWTLAALTPLLAGATVARLAHRAEHWPGRWLAAAQATLAAGLIGTVVAWLGGGAIGSGRLTAIGVSPWQFGGAVFVGVGVAASLGLGMVHARDLLRRRRAIDGPPLAMRSVLSTIRDTGRVESTVDGPAGEAAPGDDQLAG